MVTTRGIIHALTFASMLIAGQPAMGQSSGPSSPSSKAGDTAAAGLKAYQFGTKAYEAGRMESAIAELTVALSSGGLDSPQLAKALFYRGVAFRKQGKPGQAISDLMSAVWLRDGLSEVERATASDHCKGSYRDAGINEPPDQQFAQQPSAPVAASAVVVPTGVRPVSTAAAMPEPRTWAPASSETVVAAAPILSVDKAPVPVIAAAPAPPPRIAAVETVPASASPVGSFAEPAGESLPWTTQQESSDVAAPAVPPFETSSIRASPVAPEPTVPTTPPASTAMAAAGAALSDAGQSVSNFIGSLVAGTATTETASQSAPTITATAPRKATQASVPIRDVAMAPPTNVSQIPPVAPLRTPPEQPVPATTDWKYQTETAASVAPSGSDLEAQAPPSQNTGKYSLQIAAEHSLADAEKVAERLKARHALSLRGMVPEIYGPATRNGPIFGSMGPSYRVSIGPYSTRVEPGRLCNILRPHGYDCRVVTD